MKTILLAAGSRAGADFFQTLLDGHPQVMQFPGAIEADAKLIKILSSDNGEEISSNFSKYYVHFFDSKMGWGKFERMDQLGENKNESFLVDKEKFKLNFSKLFKEKKISKEKYNIFDKILMLHKAYSLTCGEDVSKKKIMLINCHTVKWTKYIAKKIKNADFSIVHTVRNPLSSVSSSVNNWLRYENGKHFFAKSIFFHLDLIVNGIKELKKIKKEIYIIKLEMLHKNNFEVMNDFCNIYDLNYNDCMRHSTYLNLMHWGDSASVKYLRGVNKDYKISYNENTFYKRDIKFLEYILKDYIIYYGYKLTNETSKIFFNFLPMKCEILTWKNTLKHKKIKHILSIPFFYIKRLLYINKFSQKNLKLPYSFGLKLKNY